MIWFFRHNFKVLYWGINFDKNFYFFKYSNFPRKVLFSNKTLFQNSCVRGNSAIFHLLQHRTWNHILEPLYWKFFRSRNFRWIFGKFYELLLRVICGRKHDLRWFLVNFEKVCCLEINCFEIIHVKHWDDLTVTVRYDINAPYVL